MHKKAFDRVQHLLMIKTLSTGLEGTDLHIILKAIYEKVTVNMKPMGKN